MDLILDNLPEDPMDLLSDQEKADLQEALDRIAASRRRAWAEGQHLPVGY